MDIVLEEIVAGLPDVQQMVSLMVRLLIAAGLGRWGLALASTALTWITLSIIGIIENEMNKKQ